MIRRIALLCVATLLAGCARYDIVTTNGTITNVPTPKLVPGTRTYVYKVNGTNYYIPELRVREINAR